MDGEEQKVYYHLPNGQTLSRNVDDMMVPGNNDFVRTSRMVFSVAQTVVNIDTGDIHITLVEAPTEGPY